MHCCRVLRHAAALPVRVRFAPSPTGYLHLGGLRTALYNYLFARRHGGVFIVRIEDTDEERRVEGSVESLLRTLAWCGLGYDEGPGALPSASAPPGAAPYVQSQRLPLYVEHAQRLLASGHAYRCFCTQDRLQQLREQQAAKGHAPGYDGACRGLPAGQAQARAAAGEAHVVRLAVPLGGTTHLSDAVLGEVRFPHAAVDDQVLLKSSGWPTYHLACVVDDHLMGVTHVIRGQEWLPSTPKHLLLYQALGWQPPAFAHLPLLLNQDRSKLSKRKGDAAVEDYAAGGFLPQALVNFVALLGWTPQAPPSPTATLQQLAQAFSLADIHRANAVVDRQKLEWTNGQHIKAAFKRQGAGEEEGAAAAAAMPDIVQGAAAAARPALEALLGQGEAAAALEAAGGGPASSPAAAARFQALLAAQHERVGALSDFGPLLLPFLLAVGSSSSSSSGERVFLAYLGGRAPQEALQRIFPASAAAAAASTVTAAAAPPCLQPLAPLLPAFQQLLVRWEALQASGAFAHQGAQAAAAVKAAAKAVGLPPGKLMLPLRWALTGLDAGAALGDTLGLLGGQECLARLRLCVGALAQGQAQGP